MFSFFKNNRNNKKMESKPIKIIDKGHYREITYGSEAPKTVNILGASKEHEGMWLTSERDAKGNNVLISEHVLLHSYEAIDVQPLHTEGDISKKLQIKSMLFEGIGEDTDVYESPASPTYDEINEIHHEIQNTVENIVPNVHKFEPAKQVTTQQRIQPNVDDDATFLHRKVVEKFILPNKTTHTNPVVFNLTTNVDIQKLINGMQLMDLDPEIVLNILLENPVFKSSLVQIFGGSFVKKTPDVSNKPVVVNFTLAESTPIEDSSTAPKIAVEGKYSVAEISPEIEEEKTGTVFVQVTGKQNYEEVAKLTAPKNPWSNKVKETPNFIQPKVEESIEKPVVSEQPKVVEKPIKKPVVSNMDMLRNIGQPKVLSQEEINQATQLKPVETVDDFPQQSTDELLKRVEEFKNKEKLNLD